MLYIDQVKFAVYLNHGLIRSLPFLGPTSILRPFWVEIQNIKGVIASALILTRRASLDRDWAHDPRHLSTSAAYDLNLPQLPGFDYAVWDNFE